MKNTHNNRQWFGFSEDKVFGEIMSNPAFCRHVLQGILPEIPIKKIFPPKKQEVIIDPEHRDQKDVRLDILVEDINGNLYNIEMQRSDDDILLVACAIMLRKTIKGILSTRAILTMI